MCFGGKPKEPPAPPPPPAPAPLPTAPEQSPVTTDERKRRRDLLRSGLASTIKTGGQGIFGKGSQLSATNTGLNKTLG